MSIIDRDGENAVITPQTDILSSEAARFKDDLRELINSGVKHLTIDCRRVEMVDSLGVGLVIAAHNSLLKVGGALRLVNTSAEVYDLLVSMRLNTHIDIQSANHAEPGN
ncbi:MAG: serine/threonine-protein kinase RsbW [Desulfovibrionales bacterium]|jgi:anti-anti-sigma factor|nr:serine/threonine-protein kinase RsbW [Desulfovibrionales bacterium]